MVRERLNQHEVHVGHMVHPEAVEATRRSMMDDEEFAGLAETFAGLADSNRVKILFALMERDLCVCDLASVVGISESAVSQHLRILRTLRWVKNRRDGRVVYYSLEDQHVRSLLELEMEHMRGG